MTWRADSMLEEVSDHARELTRDELIYLAAEILSERLNRTDLLVLADRIRAIYPAAEVDLATAIESAEDLAQKRQAWKGLAR